MLALSSPSGRIKFKRFTNNDRQHLELTSKMDLSKILLFVTFGLLGVSVVSSQENVPTECDRGVRRHHPSQANVYQVFTRKDYIKQWISYSCPEYKVFDPRACECVSGRQLGPQSPRNSDGSSTEELRSEAPEHSPLVEREIQTFRDEEAARSTREHDDGNNPIRPQSRNYRRQVWSDDSRDRGSPVPDSSVQSNDHKKEFQRDQHTERDSRPAKNVSLREKAGHEPTCQLHRATKDPAVFERWSDGQWVAEDCNWPFYTGLVWTQEACRCEWGPNRTLAMPLTGNGVSATCLMMLSVTFDKGEIRDEGRHIWLNVKHQEGASVQKDSTAVGGFSGSFRGSSIVIPYFKSNVLGDIFHIGFSFKLCPGNPDTDIVLLHNDCPEAEEGPSVVISYQAWSKQITVALRTINTDGLTEDKCTLKQASMDKWTKVDVRYGDSFLEISINDELCTESDKHYGLVATNNCPMTLLGEAFCGNLDEVVITRGCTDAHAIS
ncbi:hypothetical protein EGW08_015421 [Elysia chlorotica]|uniref:Uncharacterized protein n=1 Tax=Elysia chlorotica TaxID=188477 RepID=A0A3S0ZKA9_ELYCH|nr:hypothetical protein EGW08_015421 [Elysia chlorotica]